MIILQTARARGEFLRFSQDGRLVALHETGAVVWDHLAAGAAPATIASKSCTSAHFTPDGRKLLLGGYRPLIHDFETGRSESLPPVFNTWGQDGFELSPDGRTLILAQMDTRRPQPGRLSRRRLDDPGTSLWFVDTPRYPLTRPLFLARSESV